MGLDRNIALQLLGGIIALGQDCSRTQVSTLFVCKNFRTASKLERNDDILQTLPSQSHLFFQIRTASSI